MRNFGFCDKWIRWMKACISLTSVSVLVNGAPTEEFQPQKGLRQGDPFLPFLFIIAAEGLNLLLARAKVHGLFRGAIICSNDVSVSHLQFADDTIIFCKGDNEDILNIKRVLRWANPRKQSTWNPVVQKVKKKLSSWKRKLLSYVGRLTVIKAVLGNLPIYFLSLFRMPKSVVKALDKLQSSFLWGGNVNKRKMHLVKWKEITKSKSQGGLGVRDLGEVNECLLLKWWRRIKVGNGGRIRFWQDKWLNNRDLQVQFPRLYSLSTEKEETLQQISAKKNNLGLWQLKFRRQLFVWEIEELQILMDLLETSTLVTSDNVDSCS
ncbi:uncharacterized protein LOC114269378 [Camellia sinensis]|uniref:uncharacterized protein LOC114269378 n=1 Tax=Camellia sinensis TaxID=4442 RepID=UPI0010357397|nr:uncharacterized protein LOC114269378 [Camellia sinensis]